MNKHPTVLDHHRQICNAKRGQVLIVCEPIIANLIFVDYDERIKLNVGVKMIVWFVAGHLYADVRVGNDVWRVVIDPCDFCALEIDPSTIK